MIDQVLGGFTGMWVAVEIRRKIVEDIENLFFGIQGSTSVIKIVIFWKKKETKIFLNLVLRKKRLKKI